MQELYLDKSSGIISSAQFMELNQTFLHDVEDLEKLCAKLEGSLGETGDTDGQREKLKQYLSYKSHRRERLAQRLRWPHRASYG